MNPSVADDIIILLFAVSLITIQKKKLLKIQKLPFYKQI